MSSDNIYITGDVCIDYLVQARKNSRPAREVKLVLMRDGNVIVLLLLINTLYRMGKYWSFSTQEIWKNSV